jgi:hypothetical protein
VLWSLLRTGQSCRQKNTEKADYEQGFSEHDTPLLTESHTLALSYEYDEGQVRPFAAHFRDIDYSVRCTLAVAERKVRMIRRFTLTPLANA